jgi:hypothetical protein
MIKIIGMVNSVDWANPDNYGQLPSMQQGKAFLSILSDARRKTKVRKGLVKGLPKDLYINKLGPLGIKTNMM